MERNRRSLGNGFKIAVSAELLQNTGTDIEKAAVELKIAGINSAGNPREGHQIVKRKPNRFMLANILSMFRRRLHGARSCRLGDTHPLANEVGKLRRWTIQKRLYAAAHRVSQHDDLRDL